MSLLLDALRKSEAQRRAGETPSLDLGSGDVSLSGRSRARSGEWLGWLVVLAVVIGGGAGLAWWQPWTSLQSAPTQAGGPAVANVPVSDVVAVAVSEPEPAVTVSTERPAESAAAVRAEPVPQEPAPSVRSNESMEAEAAQEQAASTGPGPDLETPTPAVVDEAPASEAPAAENRMAESRVPEVLAQDRGRVTAPSAAVADPAAATTAAGDPPEKAETITAPLAGSATVPERDASLDGVIRPWELPQELRAEFPELRLTVHFYAARPADRFVLIDGERRGEGDSLGGGARIAEIRKRGLIVDFQRYRILIE